MSSTIAVDDLCVGMFIQLEGGWLSHPFPRSSFRIASAEQIQTLHGLGLKHVRWAPEKSVVPANTASLGVQPRRVASPGRTEPETRHADPRRRELEAEREVARLCERQHAEAASAWRQAADAVMAEPQEAARAAHELTRTLLDRAMCSGEVGIRLVSPGTDRVAAHALNVGLISLLVARTLGASEAELMEIGLGALLHDVGKLELPECYRHAEEGFDAQEMAAYRDHVARGLVLGQRMGLSPGALQVLTQHHEHADGSGFPLKLTGERIGLGARVVALVNRYDRLCNPLSRAVALTPHEAVATLFAQGQRSFDTSVLNAFIRLMGVYPAGSLVQLTDDRYALVIGVNSSRPLKPRVLVHDAQVPRSEALVLDLESVPDLGIRRSLPAAKVPAAAIEYLDPRPRVAYFFESLGGAGELDAESDAA